MDAESPISDAYRDDSTTNVLFRVFRRLGWSDLVNCGYYTVPTAPALLGGLAFFQRRLVARSLALLNAGPGDRVLDACCGRGYTTARLAGAGCRALGVDISTSQIREARERFGGRPRAAFAVGDVTALPPEAEGATVTDGSFDRAHCLEAAFHFGSEGRRAFLAEAFRVLRPGGRLVLVDFTWRTPDPGAIARLDPERRVRDAWRFEELEPRERYLALARSAGFLPTRVLDWTRNVSDPFARLGTALSRVAASRAGRSALCLRWRGLRDLTERDWREVTASIHAHETVSRYTGYTALVLDKPWDKP
ncbi:methyltransferase domain-containing protein [Streptomyces sp. 6N223]|uniref:methyltransferase domain-containing protein n=1 Tax=Streptomyces sp. 6N223 TaxID=3457412 RepID=UPI003FD5330F